MKPAFQLDSGSHRAPDELYDDMNEAMVLSKDYFVYPTLTETSDLLFIRFIRLKKNESGIYNYKTGYRTISMVVTLK